MYGVWCGVGGLWDVTGRKEKRLRGGGGGGGVAGGRKGLPAFPHACSRHHQVSVDHHRASCLCARRLLWPWGTPRHANTALRA